MRRPDLRIRVQLTVSVCLFTLVCLVSLAVAIYTLSRNTLLRLERGNLDLNSRMLREECLQELEDVYDSFHRLSYSNPVRNVFLNQTDSETLMDAANLLHDSFDQDRILQMKLYASNGTSILEVDSKAFANRTGLPVGLTLLEQAPTAVNKTVEKLNKSRGIFVGPEKFEVHGMAPRYLMSLTIPIRNADQRFYAEDKDTGTTTIGFATFLLNCLKLERILSSVSLSSAANEVGTAALCAATDNFTEFQQLIPFNDNLTEIGAEDAALFNSHVQAHHKRGHMDSIEVSNMYKNAENFPIPKKMAESLMNNVQPTAQVNKGPNRSMISVSQFTVLDSVYYVVVLQSHYGTFSMTHHLRNITIFSSCIIGAGMIIFTFLFVSFGARQILRLKMAATYEQPAPKKWKVLPLPWWLRPVNRKGGSSGSDKSEFRVPEKVPLRKHVRDELDDITERFNIMSNALRKQYALLEDRVEVRKAEIEQAREAADIANAAKSHFLARVTHELRTPLNGIIGTATLCLEEDNIQQIHQSLRTIFKCGELLLHLMTDLLSFSQNEVENLDLEPRDFNIYEITSQLNAIFTEQCAGKQIRLTVDSDPRDNRFIFSGDTNRILQVIFNLMSNGIKFTPEGGEVFFKATVSDNDADPAYKMLTFYVRDNGPGIAPDMQNRVFEAFVQGDISSHVKKAGVGLGLSICRQLAERMHGEVSLKSELGKGSTFIFQLPLKFRMNDSDSTSTSGQDPLDVSGSASIMRSSRKGSAAGTVYSTPLETSNENPLERLATSGTNKSDSSGQCSPQTQTYPDPSFAGSKSTESAKTSARSMLTRTLSSTSSRTRGLLMSRRKTQDSVFRPMDFLKRRASSDTDKYKMENPASTLEGEASEFVPQVPKYTPTKSSPLGTDNSNTDPRASPLSNSPKLRTTDVSSAGGSGTNSGNNGSEPSTSPTSRPEPVASSSGGGGLRGIKEDSDSSRRLSNSIHNNNIATNASPQPSKQSQKSETKFQAQQNLPPLLTFSPTPPNSATVVPDAHNQRSNIHAGLAASKNNNERLPPSDLKVLVVDDNSVNQEVMMRMLNLEGLKSIIVANDGLDAIEKVKQADTEGGSFDIIFMDVQMPNMDGRQATRIIRTEMHKSVPIVAVSAFANEKNADDCIEAGMNLFLSKPLRRPHLREILRSLRQISQPQNAQQPA